MKRTSPLFTASSPLLAQGAMEMNHWSVSIGSTTTPVRPDLGSTILCASAPVRKFSRSSCATTALRAA